MNDFLMSNQRKVKTCLLYKTELISKWDSFGGCTHFYSYVKKKIVRNFLISVVLACPPLEENFSLFF